MSGDGIAAGLNHENKQTPDRDAASIRAHPTLAVPPG
jgi:hypothetical protein